MHACTYVHICICTRAKERYPDDLFIALIRAPRVLLLRRLTPVRAFDLSGARSAICTRYLLS